MKTKQLTKEGQVTKIVKDIQLGYPIHRFQKAYKRFNDFRSRICQAQDRLGIRFKSAYVEGQKYKQYWVEQNKLSI